MLRIRLMTRRSFAGAVAAALVLAALPAAAQPITWQMANEYPATSIHGEGDQFFAREVRERSGGRIVITHSFDAALGDMYIGALGDVHPIFLLPSRPFSPSPRSRRVS